MTEEQRSPATHIGDLATEGERIGALYAGGSSTPLAAAEVADALRRRSSMWVWLAGEPPAALAGLLAAGDGLELIAPPGAGGLAVVADPAGGAVVALAGRDDAAAVAAVRQLWRRGARLRLDQAPGRWLPAAPAWLRRGAGAAAAARARGRRVVDQLRPPADAGGGEARLFGLPSRVEAYRNLAAAGLFPGEAALCEPGGWLAGCGDLLDVGCGAGREALGFAARGLRVTGIDVCAPLVEAARALAAAHPAGARVELRVGELGELDLGAAGFDAALVSSDVYATVRGRARRVAALRALARAVRPGGPILIAVSIERGGALGRLAFDLPRALARRLGAATTAEPGDRWVEAAPEEEAPRGYRHRFFSARELLEEIAEAGLIVVERGGFWVLRAPAPPALPELRYAGRDDVRAEAVGDDLLLVQLTDGHAYRLNGTARRVFELATQGLSAAEIAARVAAATGAPEPRVRRDAVAVLDELARDALLARREGSR